MRRERCTPRPGWQAKCEAVGFTFHSADGGYWDESACYAFSADEIDVLEAATEEVHRRCLEAVDRVVSTRDFDRFRIPDFARAMVIDSWRRAEPSLFGRFDFSWDGRGDPKMLEYNADTPTSLLEAVSVGVDGARSVRTEHRLLRHPLHRAAVEDAAVEQGDPAGAVGAVPGPPGPAGRELRRGGPLLRFDGRYPVIGSWIIGDRAAGMGIREDSSPITRNSSRFIPHWFE